jgi:hypothetical protein
MKVEVGLKKIYFQYFFLYFVVQYPELVQYSNVCYYEWSV